MLLFFPKDHMDQVEGLCERNVSSAEWTASIYSLGIICCLSGTNRVVSESVRLNSQGVALQSDLEKGKWCVP